MPSLTLKNTHRGHMVLPQDADDIQICKEMQRWASKRLETKSSQYHCDDQAKV